MVTSDIQLALRQHKVGIIGTEALAIQILEGMASSGVGEIWCFEPLKQDQRYDRAHCQMLLVTCCSG